jgi:hypothetical protein
MKVMEEATRASPALGIMRYYHVVLVSSFENVSSRLHVHDMEENHHLMSTLAKDCNLVNSLVTKFRLVVDEEKAGARPIWRSEQS